jgi:hypothetical protein
MGNVKVQSKRKIPGNVLLVEGYLWGMGYMDP